MSACALKLADLSDTLGRNLTHSLVDMLGRAIVTGQYLDSRFPTEGELARIYGVSRSVTREAVKILTAKGLLSARPRQGTAVRPSTDWNLFDSDVLHWLLDRQPSLDLLMEFSQLRNAIEPEAAAQAACYASMNDRRAISNGLQRMRDAEAGKDDILDADIAFHVAILQGSQNPFFAQFRNLVTTALYTSVKFTNRLTGRSASIEDHALVERAILQENPSVAREAMRVLIADVLNLIAANK